MSDDPGAGAPPTSTGEPLQRPRSRLRRLLRNGALVLGALVLGVGFGVPWYASSAGPQRLAEALAPSFRTEVKVEAVSFSWWKGVHVEGLSVAQAAGFEGESALRVARLDAEVGLIGLLTGRTRVRAELTEARVLVVRDADGVLNWDRILAPSPDGDGRGKGGGPGGEGEPFEWPGIELVAALHDGEVEVLDVASGRRHRIRAIEGSVSTEGAEPPLSLRVDALAPGAESAEGAGVHLEARVDPTAGGRGEAKLALDVLDLQPWGELLAAFGGTIERMSGTLGGTATVAWSMRAGSEADLASVDLRADLQANDVEVTGGALGTRTFRRPGVTLRPQLRWDASRPGFDTEGFLVDLGVLAIRDSLPHERLADSDLGLSLDLDLAAVAAQEGWLPAEVEAAGGMLVVHAGLSLGPIEGGLPLGGGPIGVHLKGEGRELSLRHPSLPEGVSVPSTMSFDLPCTVSEEGAVHLEDGRVQLGHDRLSSTLDWAGGVLSTRSRLQLDRSTLAPLLAAYGPAKAKVRSGMDLDLDLRWTPEQSGESLAEMLASMTADAALQLPELEFLENRLGSGALAIAVADGKVGILSDAARTQLNRGGVALRLDWDPRAEAPFDAQLGWTGGRVGSSWRPVLQYAVPLLAGLPIDRIDELASLSFESGIGLDLKLSGPTRMPTGGDWMTLVRGWSGGGALQLEQGRFAPSSSFQTLAEWMGEGKEWTFEKIDTRFTLDGGSLITERLNYARGDRVLNLKGRTGLDGSLDWGLSLKQWLEQSERGQQALALLGDVQVPLKGTVTGPRLELGDLSDQLLQGGRNLLDQLGKDPQGTIEGLRGLFDRGKKKRDGGD